MKSEEVDDLLKSLQEQWPIIEIVSFNELDVQQKLQEQPYKLIQFSEKYIKEKSRMDDLLDLKIRLSAKLYDKLRFHVDKALSTKEIEQYYMPTDGDMIKLNNAIAKQTVIINYFEMCVKAIEKQVWSIKLWMENKRYG
jgi:hypothetical protein